MYFKENSTHDYFYLLYAFDSLQIWRKSWDSYLIPKAVTLIKKKKKNALSAHNIRTVRKLLWFLWRCGEAIVKWTWLWLEQLLYHEYCSALIKSQCDLIWKQQGHKSGPKNISLRSLTVKRPLLYSNVCFNL